MCRNIRVLLNFEPPTTDEEVRAAALQYVRKVSGTRKPSKANEALFEQAVEDVARVTRALVREMETHSPPRTREGEAAKAKARGAKRYGARVA
ncbi:DUF2277 domain-containing protein [Pendulispora albinea]|uniref:DUF2277 domain-containing protein n=1 Tax=Pendulispora albinea TaxID=2741071 RepID=A0ABZ2LZK2_9BACT